VLRAAAATAAFALIHSALASRPAKAAVQRLAGDRHRNGWYRTFYNTQAVLTAVALAAYLRRLPDRLLYKVHGPLADLMRLGQFAGLAYAALAVRQIGVGRMAGATSLAAWCRGGAVPPEPEAQGPALGPDGRLRTTGPFACSRHPLNLAPVPVLWLAPRMTVNLAAFNAVATAYLIAGSRHEEARLRASYGAAYEAYRQSGVPFYWPRVRLRP
jgi:methanethiol S-methyltransferase